ncbi:MAG: carboxypeptidase regulatory-like domain-containing protein, partial [Planctomycetota bacterium]
MQTLPGTEVSLGELTLDQGVILAGMVVDEGGRAVEGAKVLRPFEQTGGMVIISSNAAGETVAVTDAEGRFEVSSQRVGDWELIVRHEDHPDARSEGNAANAGDHQTDLLVVLEDGLGIAGVVSGIPAAERGQLEVRAWPQRGEGQSDGAQTMTFEFGGGAGMPSREGPRVAPVAADGSFALRGLRRDARYRLAARLAHGGGPGQRTGRSANQVAQSGERGVELEWSMGSSVSFQVLDARSGKPIEDLRVSAGLRWAMPLTGSQGRVLDHFEDGRVVVDGLWPREDMDQLSIELEAAGYEAYSQTGITLAAEDDLDLGTVRLAPMPLVRVTVLDDESGDPVEGAKVTLRAEQARGSRNVRVSARSFGAGDDDHVSLVGEDLRVGRTDSRGVCELSSFPGKRATLLVRAEDFAPAREDSLQLPSKGDVEREVRLILGGTVAITVVDGAGQPAPGATIEHDSPGAAGGPIFSGGTERTADEHGRLRFSHLEPGLHAFRVQDENPSSGGFLMAMSMPGQAGRQGTGWEEVTVAGGEESQVRLVLPPRGSLHGIITEDGSPLARARVALNQRGDLSARMRRMIGGGTSVTTDSAGRYSFDDLKLADYDVEITHSSRAMGFEAEIDLLEGDNKLNIELPVCILEGKVTDENGEPLEGARVTVSRKQALSRGGMRMVMISRSKDGDDGFTSITTGGGSNPSTTTDEHGHYSLRGVAAAQEVYVEVKSAGYEPTTSKALTLQPGELRRAVDVQLGRGGTLVVSVTDALGEPADGLFAMATFLGESETPVQSVAKPVQAGEARLENLVLGPWSVSLRSLGGTLEGAPPMPPEQSVEVGAEEEARLSF